jgi:hypothetical protein
MKTSLVHHIIIVEPLASKLQSAILYALPVALWTAAVILYAVCERIASAS